MRFLPILFLVPISGAALAQSLDPIQTRSHRAFSLAFLRVIPRTDVLAPTASEWSLGWTEANDLRRSDRTSGGQLFEDYEIMRLAVGWRRGISPGVEAGIELPYVSRSGGFMDSIIDWWHRNILGWTDPLRDATPKNECTIDFPDGQQFGSAGGIGDVSGYISKMLGEGVTGTFALKLPTGNASNLLGSGAPDIGASLQGARRSGKRWAYGGQIGVVLQGKPTKLAGGRSLVDQGALWLIWLPNSRDAWIVQWQSEASPLRSRIPASDAAHRLVTFGWRRKLSERQSIEAFFSEDRDLFNGGFPEGANAGPDFTIGVRLAIKN